MRSLSFAILSAALLASPTWAKPKTIAATAQETAAFRTLTAALKQAGLVDALAGDGPFTVFAPTDAAFAKAPKVGGDQLASVLKYHVVAGRLPASAIVSMKQLETLQGQSLPVALQNGQLRIGDARVVQANIACSNGVIHVIDRVLVPEQRTIAELASKNENLSTLLAAVVAAKLDKALASKGPFTVLAPTNAAFAKLPRAVLADLLKPENRDQLTAILTYHVIPGRVTAAEALLAKQAKTLQGAELAFGYSDGALRAGPAAILLPDIAASNGVIHVIDRVLLPPSASETKADGIEAIIVAAIESGAPQFNDGNVAACTAIYEIAARAIVTLAGDALAPAARRQFEATLADTASDDRTRAWAFRRTFDSILSAAPAPAPAPKKTSSNFKPLIEAPLPVGFPQPGPVGEVVVKTYPSYRMARAKGGMFAFGTLFNHIKKNEIAMTAPVEMTMEENGKGLAQTDMAFLYANTKLGKAGEQGRVDVVDVKDARVLSFGIRGPMSQSKIADAKAAIEGRLGAEWKRAGDWRMMGYNSPMVPAKQRFWEIQLPVRAVSNS